MSSIQSLGVTSERKWKDNSVGFCFILIVMSIVLLLTMPGSYMRVRVDSLYLHACISCVRVNDET
jgi:hypothetical protein